MKTNFFLQDIRTNTNSNTLTNQPSKLFSSRRKDRALPLLQQTPCQVLNCGLKQRKRRPRKERNSLKKFENEIRDLDIEHWLRLTGRFPEFRWQIREKRALKDWFNRLDRDGSGEIDVEELTDPLLSSGLAKTISEVKQLVNRADHDKSGAIGFNEFLCIMRTKQTKQSKNDKQRRTNLPQNNTRIKGVETQNMDNMGRVISQNIVHKEVKDEANELGKCVRNHKPRKKRNANPIVKLQALQEEKGGMQLNSILAFERRKLLLDATMGEAQRRETAHDKIRRLRIEMKEMDGTSKFRTLYEIAKLMQKLELHQREKENFVSAVRDMIIGALKAEEIDKTDPIHDGERHRENVSTLKEKPKVAK